MRIEKREKRIVIDEETVYISDDGMEFSVESDCVRYEKLTAIEKLKETRLKEIKHCKELDGYLPFDSEFAEGDTAWYMPQTAEDIEVLNKCFRLEIPDEYINQWICIVSGAFWNGSTNASFYPLSKSLDYVKEILRKLDISWTMLREFLESLI